MLECSRQNLGAVDGLGAVDVLCVVDVLGAVDGGILFHQRARHRIFCEKYELNYVIEKEAANCAPLFGPIWSIHRLFTLFGPHMSKRWRTTDPEHFTYQLGTTCAYIGRDALARRGPR